jgi:hypothetical protein
MKLLAACLFLMVTAGCGDSAETNPPPTCSGASCMCLAASACDFSPSVCGNSCTLACAKQASCNGACGESCSIDCGENATCGVTVGKSGSVSCKRGSHCEVTCTGSCSVSCPEAASCRLKCGDAAFKEISGGGSC